MIVTYITYVAIALPNTIITMTWTKKYDQFSCSCGFRQSTERLLRWLLRRSQKVSKHKVCQVEIDLRDFNNEIAKERPKGAYDPKTIKEALAQLNEESHGLVAVVKSYTWAIHRTMVTPLEMVLREKSENRDLSPKPKSGNPMFSDEHKQRLAQQQQQTISKMDSLYQAIGLKFDYSSLVKLHGYVKGNLLDIKKSIELLLHRHSTGVKEIGNPFGFIVSCLQERWIDKFDIYYCPEIPSFESKQAISKFTDEIMRGIKLCPD